MNTKIIRKKVQKENKTNGKSINKEENKKKKRSYGNKINHNNKATRHPCRVLRSAFSIA